MLKSRLTIRGDEDHGLVFSNEVLIRYQVKFPGNPFYILFIILNAIILNRQYSHELTEYLNFLKA